MILEDWLSRCNQNKRTVAPNITHLICSLILLLIISLQQQAITGAFHYCLTYFILKYYICSFTETMSRKFGKFDKFEEGRFGGTE